MTWRDSVYTVTVLDIYTDPILGLRRTPAIFTKFRDAVYTVRNNVEDIADGGTYQYAVIEETVLNEVRPSIARNTTCWWFKYNSATKEFDPVCAPIPFRMMTGFGIG